MSTVPSSAVSTYDVERVRQDFPILDQEVYGKPLVYLDNAATSQKPQAVIDALTAYYRQDNSNIHRGIHALSERATASYEAVREQARAFLNAPDRREIIFTRGATEAINLVAQSWGRASLGPGDEVVITTLEHHSNILPWQLLCQERGARLRVAPVDDAGEIVVGELEALLGPKTRLVALGHVSNALGTVNPVREISALAHAAGALVLVDGAQAAPHLPIDVRALGCDFYAFSAHKVYGPTGVGVLWGRAELLEAMPPWQGGGEMIRTVRFEESTFNVIPHKFEAGTPNIAGVIGLGAALDYVGELGLAAIADHEHDLLVRATKAVSTIPGLRLIGTAREKAAVLSFVIDDVHPHDVGTILDREGIAVRTGHHCAQPLMDRFGVAATARASFGLYNTRDEVDCLARGIEAVLRLFR